MPSAPHFLFNLVEKKTGRGRSKRNGRFCRAPVQWPSALYGGLPNRCAGNLLPIYRLAPDQSNIQTFLPRLPAWWYFEVVIA